MSEITLVSDQHDDNIGIGVIPEFFQPSCDVVIGLVFADIVDQQCANSSAVVSRGDGTVSFLTCGIPDLRFDCLGVDLDRTSRELDTDRRLGVKVEFVAGESTQQIGLADARVTDQDDCHKSMSASDDGDIAQHARGRMGGTFEEELQGLSVGARGITLGEASLTSYSSFAMIADPAINDRGRRVDVEVQAAVWCCSNVGKIASELRFEKR